MLWHFHRSYGFNKNEKGDFQEELLTWNPYIYQLKYPQREKNQYLEQGGFAMQVD